MNELNKNNVSETVRRLNPGLFGVDGLQNSKPKHTPKRRCAPKNTTKKGGKKSMGKCMVTITSFRQKPIPDRDNLIGGAKSLRDAIAKSIGLDDADKFIEWKYYQTKVEKRSEEGTLVKIEI